MRLLLVEDTVELANWLQKALTQKASPWTGWPTAWRRIMCCKAKTMRWWCWMCRGSMAAVLARLRKRGQRVPVLLLTAQRCSSACRTECRRR